MKTLFFFFFLFFLTFPVNQKNCFRNIMHLCFQNEICSPGSWQLLTEIDTSFQLPTPPTSGTTARSLEALRPRVQAEVLTASRLCIEEPSPSLEPGLPGSQFHSRKPEKTWKPWNGRTSTEWQNLEELGFPASSPVGCWAWKPTCRQTQHFATCFPLWGYSCY